ncbi:uncharacterized protein LOC143254548 [Tachypleus tridentatus]|uniref:uncharacterized protein LOC143254548 n=1 Tax=Tachypleus tridentatus TaxID=6853 RepID=UPI003FD30922
MVFRSTILVLVILALASSWLAHARYLPTRADQTRKEQIKDILRMLLEMSTEDHANLGKPFSAYEYPRPIDTAKRSPLALNEGALFQRESLD